MKKLTETDSWRVKKLYEMETEGKRPRGGHVKDGLTTSYYKELHFLTILQHEILIPLQWATLVSDTALFD